MSAHTRRYTVWARQQPRPHTHSSGSQGPPLQLQPPPLPLQPPAPPAAPGATMTSSSAAWAANRLKICTQAHETDRSVRGWIRILQEAPWVCAKISNAKYGLMCARSMPSSASSQLAACMCAYLFQGRLGDAVLLHPQGAPVRLDRAEQGRQPPRPPLTATATATAAATATATATATAAAAAAAGGLGTLVPRRPCVLRLLLLVTTSYGHRFCHCSHRFHWHLPREQRGGEAAV